MSIVSEAVKCPQCGDEEADHEFNCKTSEEETLCPQCGYRGSWAAKRDEDGQFLGWKHEITQGVGVLWYRPADGIAFACHSLHTPNDLAKAERWLQEQLAAGTVDHDTARLTRWNKDAGRVELVVGTFDPPGRMEQIVADLGLNPIKCSPEKAVRFAILPTKAAVVMESSRVVVPVLHYLNANPADGKYKKTTDGSMPLVEHEVKYLALSRSELQEISNLQQPRLSLYGIDIVMNVSYPAFGRKFRRVCNSARWTQDPAIRKQVEEGGAELSAELAATCAGRSDVAVVPNLPLAYTQRQNDVTPAESLNTARMVKPLTHDEWLRAFGIYECATCGTTLLKGTEYVWQGKNRWCEKCFWGEDSGNMPDKTAANERAD